MRHLPDGWSPPPGHLGRALPGGMRAAAARGRPRLRVVPAGETPAVLSLLDPVTVGLTGLAVLVGATVQSSTGLGLGLVAAPVLTALDPSLMPGSILAISAVLPLLT